MPKSDRKGAKEDDICLSLNLGVLEALVLFLGKRQTGTSIHHVRPFKSGSTVVPIQEGSLLVTF